MRNETIKCEEASLWPSKEVDVCNLLEPKYISVFIRSAHARMHTHIHTISSARCLLCYSEVLDQKQFSCIACNKSPLKLWIFCLWYVYRLNVASSKLLSGPNVTTYGKFVHCTFNCITKQNLTHTSVGISTQVTIRGAFLRSRHWVERDHSSLEWTFYAASSYQKMVTNRWAEQAVAWGENTVSSEAFKSLAQANQEEQLLAPTRIF